MEKRIHLYVIPNSLPVLVTLVFLCASVPARLLLCQDRSSDAFFSQLLLPSAAALLFAAILLFDGKECFYKTAIPVCMLVVYCGIGISMRSAGKLLIWLCWIALAFQALVYAELSSGIHPKSIWLLNPVMLAALAAGLYLHKAAFSAANWKVLLSELPDFLIITGCWLLTFGLRIHPSGEYHRTWGDRRDGRRLRTLSPMDQVSPYIMVERSGATNSFEESCEITNVDRYIRQKRREGLTSFGILHVLLACYCRAIAKYPGLNRFISGQKVYTHGEDLQFCMTIKKEMSTTAPETVIKVHLSPRDTAYDVYRKVNAEIEKAKEAPLNSGFDRTAHILMLVPGVLLKFLVWVLKTLDYFGLLPAFLLEVSPFHGSIFFTSMGSLGIRPIYHHLYNFGNLPLFCAFGCKRRAAEMQEDGTVIQKKYLDMKFSMDERIVDGYYYAAFFKHFKRIISHPEILDQPPEEVLSDID